MSAPVASINRADAVQRLTRSRPRSRFVRSSLAGVLALVGYAWLAGDWRLDEFVSQRRIENLRRFVGEIVPYPLQGRAWDWSLALDWFAELMATRGWDAAIATLAISVAAIALAGVAGLVLSFLAARSLATAEPYLPHAYPSSHRVRALWRALVWLTRAFLIFLRAIPEYMWAFLLIAVIGPNPWAAVLALALHNTGVLGKLNADVIENLTVGTLQSLRGLGAHRHQIAVVGIMPAMMLRFLLLFFYRWEACIREATVLGMLGIVSLGFYVADARARQSYDVMLALILLGWAVIVVGDLLSAAAREAVRRSG